MAFAASLSAAARSVTSIRTRPSTPGAAATTCSALSAPAMTMAGSWSRRGSGR
ncbi:hypothetical protein [Actinomadura madurae]|uniref:hypothetical protein n=1 Tax=Actinomadura madurae TaxID=1993 RepID=UPI0020D212DD|nr:hypothetical protein [Actinomadura madurae]MCP9949602.1 hypothetical protein [Actinomadura madurae]MCP9966356.1 hypothetical protein [Actinomadura madurae]